MFEIKKDMTKWIIAGTGQGWQLIPRVTNKMLFCLNDFIHVNKYGIDPDLLCIMDILDSKPQIISGNDDLGQVIKRINQMNCPLIAPYKYEEIPKSEAFPLEEVVKKYGHPYFTNTICYMIAYALYEEAKEIDLYGVNQAGSHEYSEERGGVEYWLGVAVGLGVKVTVNGKNSQVLKFKGRYGKNILYGYMISYEEMKKSNKLFGVGVIKKLSTPTKADSGTKRKISP